MTELTHFFHTLCLFLFPLFPPTTQRPLFHLVWIFSIDCLQVINLAFHSVVLFRYCIFSSKNPLSVDMNTLREGNGTPLQYSCLENPRDRGACWAAVYGVAQSWTRLSNFTFTFHFHALEKEMAAHSSVLAWRIPGTEEPVGLPSMGSHRVGHD